jgi:hypothetical protein
MKCLKFVWTICQLTTSFTKYIFNNSVTCSLNLIFNKLLVSLYRLIKMCDIYMPLNYCFPDFQFLEPFLVSINQRWDTGVHPQKASVMLGNHRLHTPVDKYVYVFYNERTKSFFACGLQDEGHLCRENALVQVYVCATDVIQYEFDPHAKTLTLTLNDFVESVSGTVFEKEKIVTIKFRGDGLENIKELVKRGKNGFIICASLIETKNVQVDGKSLV